MSYVIFKRDFAPVWAKIEPYLQAEQHDPALFATAYKALYVFLCSISKGSVDRQMKAIHLEHEVNRDVDFPSESQKIEESIQQALQAMRSLDQEGKRVDRQFVVEEITKLKEQADILMKIEIGFRWKCCVLCCPFV